MSRDGRILAAMARPLRIDQPDTFYHVVNRGNERRAVFRDDADYQGFLDRLGRCCERFEIDCFAYVLMGNHYHLLVKTRQANLSVAMQWLQVAYSTWHNHRHGRAGHWVASGRVGGNSVVRSAVAGPAAR